MPQSLEVTKQNFASQTVTLAERILDLAHDCDEFAAFFFANALNSGAANEYVQGDFDGTANEHLTPAIIGLVVTAAQLISTEVSTGVRNNMRSASTKPLP